LQPATDTTEANGEDPVENDVTKPELPMDAKKIRELVLRAHQGDESAAPEIRELLDRMPDWVQTLSGDMAHLAEQTLVRAIAGQSIAQQEALHWKMDQLRRELAGPNPQPLERLLAEQVVLCWLQVNYATCLCGQATESTMEYREFLQRQQDRAQRRYLAAMKTLASVRRLNLPIKVDLTVAGTVEARNTGRTCRTTAGIVQAGRLQRH
jgi:hypothetical protein